jgi:hypothetical protein
MQLYERGELDLDGNIQDYVGDLNDAGDGNVIEQSQNSARPLRRIFS